MPDADAFTAQFREESAEQFAEDSGASLDYISATPFVPLDLASIPPRQWIYGKHYVRKFLSVTGAWGGSGKTQLLLAEAVAMATGLPLLGIESAEPLRVWHYNLEEPREELERRLAAIIDHFEIDQNELRGRFWFDGRERRLIVAREENGAVVATPSADQLEAEIKRHQIDVTQIDPFVKAHHVPENINEKIDKVCTILGDIADATNSAIELSHHIRKPGGERVGIEDVRGGGAIVAAARTVRMINPMTGEEAKTFGIDEAERRWHVRLDPTAKANMLPPAEHAVWMRFTSHHLPNGDQVGILKPWTPPDAFADLSLEAINRLLDQIDEAVQTGDPYRITARSDRWLGNLITTEFDRSDGQAKAIIKEWKKNGVLAEFEFGDPSNRHPRKAFKVGIRPGTQHD
jgi:AAA domain